MREARLPFDDPIADPPPPVDDPQVARDRAARARAVDPRYNVVLEASAGTGKTRVLVDRYVNLLRAGVDPANVLAITFTRKAAAEMKERIVATLRLAAERGEIAPSRWRDLRERLGEIAISTIDAFCLGLLREFPLEADVDPGFTMADETDVPLLVAEALDRAMRVCRALAPSDEEVALVFAQIGERRARGGLAALLDRRLVAPAALARAVAGAPRDLRVDAAARRGAAALLAVFSAMPGGLDAFLEAGPPDPAFLVMGRTLRRLAALHARNGPPPPLVHAAFARVRDCFLTQDGRPRARPLYPRAAFASPADWQVHRTQVVSFAPALADAQAGYRRDLAVLVARGVRTMYGIAEREYRRTLAAHAVLDFPEVLARTLDLLRHMDEFAQSRYRLESRYHHVLVDEFQDTSRAQWELVSLLVQSWGEGAGLAHTGPLQPSIFIVGDRKQSIYRFRDADVSLLQEARVALEALRPHGDVRRTISRSFRSVPALLSFVNDVCRDMDATSAPGAAAEGAVRHDAFRYGEDDRFPLVPDGHAAGGQPLGLFVADAPAAGAAAVASEIARLLDTGVAVRDRTTGVPRAVRAGDIAVLFRTRESHREIEEALDRWRVPSYVYKGLGFFDADEVRDVLALVGYLAEPASDLRAAAWLRSRFIRLSDEGLRLLAPRIAGALLAPDPPAGAAHLDAADAGVFATARAASERWRRLVDRVPPAELIDHIVADAAYLVEMRGPRRQQARENLKKLRAIVRRMQNRGYLSMSRLAARLDRLAVGEEANAIVDAADAVHLMTIHAAKGLEFPVVFLVNLTRGSGGTREAIRVTAAGPGPEAPATVAIGDVEGEADEEAAAADREETKRLLYVALTRARDRLYLGAIRRDGRLHPARGSLADVLPASLLDLFGPVASAGAGEAIWRGASGAAHTFHVCAAVDPPALPATPPAAGDEVPADFAALEPSSTPRRHAAAVGPSTASSPAARVPSSSDRLVGTLVHRLVDRLGFVEDAADEMLRLRLQARLRPGDAADLAALDDWMDRAIALYRALTRRSDVRALIAAGEPLHEVPFTMAAGGAIVRGTLDCLVRLPGRVVVLEFKTGQPHPGHRTQLDIYVQAAQLLFPGLDVEGRLVYPSEGAAV